MYTYFVQDARAVRVHWFAFGVKRGRCLRSFTDSDAGSVTRPEFIDNHYILAVRLAGAQGLETEGHTNHPAGACQRGMGSRQRHGANHLSDAHGRPTPVKCRPRLRGRQFWHRAFSESGAPRRRFSPAFPRRPSSRQAWSWPALPVLPLILPLPAGRRACWRYNKPDQDRRRTPRHRGTRPERYTLPRRVPSHRNRRSAESSTPVASGRHVPVTARHFPRWRKAALGRRPTSRPWILVPPVHRWIAGSRAHRRPSKAR